MENDDKADRLERDAREIIATQTRKLDALGVLARRLVYINLVLLFLIIGIGATAIDGARISSSNNRVLHESEFAYCSVGIPPPAIANTKACKAAAARYAARQATQGGAQLVPFARLVCEFTADALGGDPAKCKTAVPRK